MSQWSEHCPAKLNLYLAVNGRRGDGFHDLVSLVVKLDFGDDLAASLSSSGADTLSCDDAALSAGPDNLVMKAAAAYRSRVPEARFMDWVLSKRVPSGAGLGGGSSDAAAALRILNAASASALDADALREVAASVGSDCPLFLFDGPCLMRGRGEVLEPLPEAAAAVLRGRGVVVVKPHFGIPTGWAYSALAPAGAFIAAVQAEAELTAWVDEPDSAPPRRNSFQTVVFAKYLCYTELNAALAREELPQLALTGSGSACHAFADPRQAERISILAKESLGEGSFSVFAKIR